MRIDAHQHVWKLDRGDYGWLTPALAPIFRDFSLEDAAPFHARHHVKKTILVQAAPTVAETRHMLDVAAQAPFVAGVVGWMDFDAPNAPDAVTQLAAERLIVGVRPMVQDIADDDWLLRPQFGEVFRALAAHGLVFDALTLPRHLSRLLVVLARHPDMPVVVDHGSKPFIRDGLLDPWRADIKAVAAHPNAVCKLSGLVTEAGPDWKVARLRPYVEHLLAVFGPRRLVWGSDWPVVNLAGGYDRWVEAAEALLGGCTAQERAAIFGGNAERVYLSRAEA